MKPIPRRRRLVTTLLFPFLAIAFLIGFIANVCGESKHPKPKVKQKSQPNKKVANDAAMGMVPQEELQQPLFS